MFCTKCGSRVEDGDMFCWNCGAKMTKTEKKEEKITGGGTVKAGHDSGFTDDRMNEKDSYETSSVTMKSSAGMSIAEVNREFDLEKLPSKQETGIKSFYVFDFLSRLFSKSNIL